MEKGVIIPVAKNENPSLLLKKSKTSFGFAFLGLEKSQREALEALYGYCRVVDDIVDEAESPQDALSKLNRWREIVDRIDRTFLFDEPLIRQLSEAVGQFSISKNDLLWILDGVETDLHQNRFAKIEDLLRYCDGVASSVGFCTMAILRADRNQVSDYVYATGRALQLTNILRDVGVDARLGRIYLPLEDLDMFKYSERDILHELYNERFIKLMAFEAGRIRSYYHHSDQLLSLEDKKKFAAAEVMRQTYWALFKKLEKKRFKVFQNKIRLGKMKRISIAFSTWLPYFFSRKTIH